MTNVSLLRDDSWKTNNWWKAVDLFFEKVPGQCGGCILKTLLFHSICKKHYLSGWICYSKQLLVQIENWYPCWCRFIKEGYMCKISRTIQLRSWMSVVSRYVRKNYVKGINSVIVCSLTIQKNPWLHNMSNESLYPFYSNQKLQPHPSSCGRSHGHS